MTPLPRARVVATAVLVALSAAAPAATPAPPHHAAGLAYYAMGDSTASGTGAEQGGGYPNRIARRLQAAGMPVALTIVGVPGATVTDLRRDQVPRVVAARPALVTLGIGINDLMKKRRLADFARDLEIAADFLKRSKAAVVVLTLPDLSLSPRGRSAPPSLSRRIEAYNAALARVAERHGFVIADVYGGTRRALRTRGNGLFSRDGFHPNAAGYELWADAIWPAVEKTFVEPRREARHPAAPAASTVSPQ